MKYKDIEIENNKIITKLNKENYKAYKEIAIYLDLDSRMDLRGRIIKNDIVKMLYDGQVRGENWEEVIGENIEEFAENIKKEREGAGSKLKLLYTLRNVVGVVFLVLFMTLVTNLFNLETAYKNGVRFPIYMLAGLIAGIIYVIYITNHFNETKQKHKPWYNIGVLIGPVIIFTSIITDYYFSINFWFFTISLIISFILTIVFHIEYKKEMNRLFKESL